MKTWIAFWAILKKDLRTYYLKPPNLSWGIIFPLAWTLMFFIKSGSGLGEIRAILPGVVALSILFGATSMLAVTVTFEKKGRSFERLLLAPMPLETLLLAKTSGAILMGAFNVAAPIGMATFFANLDGISWWRVASAVMLIAVSSTFIGLFIAVSVSEVFEAQAFSNFFRFPMIFLCGLFFPISTLPTFLQPLSYALPLTYGADLLHGAVNQTARLPDALNFTMLIGFCGFLFLLSLRIIRNKWIA
jgi:ABC-2 type transport system permease protein